jgi:hypothetical protein
VNHTQKVKTANKTNNGKRQINFNIKRTEEVRIFYDRKIGEEK